MMLDRLYLLSMLNLDTGGMLGDVQLKCGLEGSGLWWLLCEDFI